MENVTFIMPLHEYDASYDVYLKRSIGSINALEGNDECRILFVGPNDVVSAAEGICKELNVKIHYSSVVNDDTNMFVQINKAVYSCVTPYFSVIEFDDTIRPYALEMFTEYKEVNPAVNAFMTLAYNIKDEQPISLSNEIVWSQGFSDNIGYLCVDGLKSYVDYNMSGAFIKTEDFIANGMLKKSFTIAAWYEYLLRAVKKGNSIFVIPKVCYDHTIMREGSYLMVIKDKIPANYAIWLIEQAETESDFTEERELPEFKDKEEKK